MTNGLEYLSYSYGHGTSDGVLRATEVSRSLSGLLQECEQNSMTNTLERVSESAILQIHRWLTVHRPTIEYVESLWDGPGKPSNSGPIGFRTPAMDE